MAEKEKTSFSTITTEEAKNYGVNDLFQKLSSNAQGLSSAEAKECLQKYGYNEIAEKKKSMNYHIHLVTFFLINLKQIYF
jgi:magnesium-transporting ATPase (P-type)